MNIYPENIDLWFTHNTRPENILESEILKSIHDQCRALAEYLATNLPIESVERQLALQKLEECVYWSNTAISRS